MKPEEQWQRLAAQARQSLPPVAEDNAPHGFATRVVALADLAGPDSTSSLITRLRNWSLATAGTAALTLALLLALQEPKTQFIPVPELDLPSPAKP